MSLPRSVRLDHELELETERYLKINELKFPQLIKMAIAKFISEPQTIQLMPVNEKEFLSAAKKAFKKHKDTMDRLK